MFIRKRRTVTETGADDRYKVLPFQAEHRLNSPCKPCWNVGPCGTLPRFQSTVFMMNSRLLRQWSLPLIVLVIVSLLMAWLLGSRTERKPPKLTEKTWQVAVVEIEPQRLSPQLRLYGLVEAEGHVTLTAPAAADVAEVFVQSGEQVAAGTTLLQLSPEDFEPLLRQREADLAELRAQQADLAVQRESERKALKEEQALLELARRNLERVTSLRKNRLSSDTAISDARERLGRQQLAVIAREQSLKRLDAQAKQLEARVQRAQALLDQARLALQRSVPIAPAEVVIDEVPVAPGDRLRGGDPMVSWYRPDSLQVRARLPLAYREELQQALQSANAPLAKGMGIDFSLERLAGSASLAGIDAWLRPIEQSTLLRPGLSLELLLNRPPKDRAIAVPASALYDESRLFRVVEGRMQSVEVQPLGFYIDEEGEHWRLVESPELKGGDRVVVTHLPNASEGLKVRVIGDSPEQAGKGDEPASKARPSSGSSSAPGKPKQDSSGS